MENKMPNCLSLPSLPLENHPQSGTCCGSKRKTWYLDLPSEEAVQSEHKLALWQAVKKRGTNNNPSVIPTSSCTRRARFQAAELSA